VFVLLIYAYIYQKITPFEVISVNGVAWEVEEFISYGIARIAVLLFFITSGYLFFKF